MEGRGNSEGRLLKEGRTDIEGRKEGSKELFNFLEV
jgi:hypothetical protein